MHCASLYHTSSYQTAGPTGKVRGFGVLRVNEMESEVARALGQLGREPALDEVVPSSRRQRGKRPLYLRGVN